MKNLNLHAQRKKLNKMYDTIINQKDLPEAEFDHLMRLWICENEKLEHKEERFESHFIQHNNLKPVHFVSI